MNNRKPKKYLIFLIILSALIATAGQIIEEDEPTFGKGLLSPGWIYYRDGLSGIYYFSAPEDWEFYPTNVNIGDRLFFGNLSKTSRAGSGFSGQDSIFVNITLGNAADEKDLSTKYYKTASDKTVKEYSFKDGGKIFVFRAVADTGRESEKLMPIFDKIAGSFTIRR